MMIDVSITTICTGGVLSILSFFSLFFSFFAFVCKNKIILYFFVLVLIKTVCFSEQIHIIFDVIIVNCMTACLGFKMAGQDSKHAGPAEGTKLHARKNFCVFYPIELKLCTMIELFIPNNRIVFVFSF